MVNLGRITYSYRLSNFGLQLSASVRHIMTTIQMRVSPRWASFLLLVVAVPSLACNSDADCSYNGACQSSGCRCTAAWSGPSCSTLNLLPATRGAGLHDIGSNMSSWGGSVLKGDDEKYHMWSSEMVNHCGLDTWTSNSHVVHAVRSSVELHGCCIQQHRGVH